ncbi:MAG: hypothetical protein ABIG44_06260 [Planctomycetota bacterium]
MRRLPVSDSDSVFVSVIRVRFATVGVYSAARCVGKGFIVHDLPRSIEQLRAIPPFEFENWAVIALGGIPNKTQVGDMGIDGRIFHKITIAVPVPVPVPEGVRYETTVSDGAAGERGADPGS